MNNWNNIPKDISKYKGFVYLIECKVNGRKYVGKKFFWSQKTKKYTRKPTKVEQIRLDRYKLKDKKKYKEYKQKLKQKYKGKKKKIKTIVESDWKDYWGSSPKLLEDIEKLGKDNFTRTIIKYCETKFDCAYEELKYQIDNNVIFLDEYYNEIINVRLRKPRSKSPL